MRRLFDNRDFRRLFLSSVVSLAGDWFSFVAVADLVTELTGRPGTAAYVYAATVLPVFLASPLAGAVGDRYDRRRVLVLADLLRVPVALALCLAVAWGSLPIAVIGIVLLGIGASFYDPISAAATPNLVDPEDLATAQSLMGMIWGSMLLVGAGLGGVVAELFGPYVAFTIDAVSFVVSAWLISGIRRPMQEPRGEHRDDDQGGLREVIRHAKRDPVVARLLFAKGGVSWANGIVGLLPGFAHGKFAGQPIATGLLFAARGLGALLGPILARRASGATPSPRSIVAICALSTLGYGAFYAVFPIVPAFWLCLIVVVLAHMGGGAQWSVSTYGLQTLTADRLRGRVMSLDYGLATLGIGMSSIAAGVIADLADETISTWWLSAVAVVYGSAWFVWSRRVIR